MARTTFFGFHYKDVESFRVNVVRNSSMFKKPGDNSKVIDGSIWEEAELKGDAALIRLVNENLVGTSVTAVLIGTETHSRRWVKYELVKSFVSGNAILGINLNRIRERETSSITPKGLNPLDRLAIYVPDDYRTLTFLELVNGRWQTFALLPQVLNRKSNSVFFEKSLRAYLGMLGDQDRKIRFSDLFDTFCWKSDDGYNNLASWAEDALAKKAHHL